MLELLKERTYRANMELFERGLIIYTWGNVSEIDRGAGVVAIKPSGVPYEQLRPEDIVLLSLETGLVVEGALRPSSDAPTHLALYRAFGELGGITHTHSTHATAWAQAGLALPCYGTTHADYFRGEVPCTRFLTAAEVAGDYEAQTGNVIIETFAQRQPLQTPGVLVRGHGPFTWGKNAAESVHNAAALETMAQMAALSRSLNPHIQALPEHIQARHYERKHGANAYYGQDSNEK